MRHRKIGRKFSRTGSHRMSMFRNMSISLIKYEIIKTSLPKAKELRIFFEPLITLARREIDIRRNNVSSMNSIVAMRRKAFNYLRDREAVKKLFEEIGPRFASRQGGYTRIVKSGFRFGDKAAMSYVELVDRFSLKKKGNDGG